MNFTSIAFYLLFAISMTLIAVAQNFYQKKAILLRKYLLLGASLIFCGWVDWRFAAILFAESIFVYMVSLHISVQSQPQGKKKWLVLGVFVEVLFLAVFKYSNFFADTFRFFGIPMQRMNIILPLGISFYTFSAIGYMVDLYNERYSPEKDFLNVWLYMSFFPKLTAGPIISADDFFRQLKSDQNRIEWKKIGRYLQIIITGLVKKNVLADHIAVFVNSVYGNMEMYNAPTLILAVFAYSVQIYFDFSGYSDLAIGCAGCLGFELPENFNMPYLSRNISEFWKRWHITLSQWLMKYIYIPLGGSRKGYRKTLRNLIITMTIGGLWHGASWNFVLWGLINGLLLCAHKQFMRIKQIRKDYVPSLPKFVVSVIGTDIMVTFCWVFFRITDIADIKRLCIRILFWKEGVAFYSIWAITGIAVLILATGIAVVKNCKDSRLAQKKFAFTEIDGFYIHKDLSKLGNLVLLFLVMGLVLGLAYAYSNPFIYAAF